MPMFANAAAFDDPKSRLRAMGSDLSAARAIVDAHGRRVHQLFIPGLSDVSTLDLTISIEHVFRLDPNQSRQGFLYL